MRVALARARLALGDRRRALTDLEQAISLETADITEVFLLGVEYLKSGRLDDAKRASEALMRRNPEHPTSHNLAGLAALAMGDRDVARKHFDQSVTLDPDYLPATNNLAQMDLEDRRPEDARARYEALLERTPDNVHVLRELGRIATKTGDFDEAMKWLREANRVDPQDMVDTAAHDRYRAACGRQRRSAVHGADGRTSAAGKHRRADDAGAHAPRARGQRRRGTGAGPRGRAGVAIGPAAAFSRAAAAGGGRRGRAPTRP